ncbi:ABC transporter substrate-binding protein [Microtetraspora niveoalba]|uniref:ABC transporter substrate-binding protein n=1 Tax=Microtetraspora niveoalba TaxID=46175 RepID=UPI00082C321E|nr:ABC transporter substrate-binding protein [Microtetraspora niveoalba]
MTVRLKPLRPRTAALMAASLVSAVALAGCGSGGDPAADDVTSPAAGGPAASAAGNEIPAQEQDPAVAALVPKEFRDKGTVTIASDASYPPMEFMAADGQTVVGLDPDLGKALGEVMGLKVSIVNSQFDAIIPGLSAGKFDIGMSGFNDTEERRKILDFVDYYKGGSSFFGKSGGAVVKTLDDLCGHRVAVQKGTVQQDDVTAQEAKCKSAGQKSIELQVYPDQAAANLALVSGRADVSIADTPIAAYQVAQSGGQFALTGDEYGVVMHGIAAPKGSGLVKPLTAALDALMKNGAYQKILDKWGIGHTKLDAPLVNGVEPQQ